MSKKERYNFIWEALENAEKGSITIYLPDAKLEFKAQQKGSYCDIKIKNYNVIDYLITGGDIALGESYIENMWETSNLANLLTYFTENSHCLEEFFHAKKLKALTLFIKSFFTKNTKSGSKKNIRSHYDLGNDFYELWLDETMTYSSAIFDNQDITLSQAQDKKYKNIISKLNHGSILEIGCGWAGFAEAAALSGYSLNCLTISQKQFLYAKKRISNLNLEKQANIKLQDYRDEKSLYDNVVSIEMFEAVGKEYWSKYFEIVAKSLKDNGKAVLQIITIDEQVFDDYVSRVDFIQKHIFPGGILPSKTIIRNLAKQHGLEVKSEFNFGLDYSKTLEMWLTNFDSKYKEIVALGFDDYFIRKWRFYLCYCIAGFNAKRTDVVQFELIKSEK
ncbi:MAG: class I SAM-dependent methyltransferase [Pelagibacterales bacterium]|nr:class I SAM-dependent methyltransferase [Pelagibacterales bacterium]